MKRKLIILATVGLVGAGAVFFYFFSKTEAVSGITLESQPYVQTIQGTGRIQADRKTDITIQVGEVLKEIRVKEGQLVQAGEILALFDDQKQVLSLKESQVLVEAASNRLASVKGASLETAESLLRQQLLRQQEHHDKMVRFQSLFEAGQISLTEMETLELQKSMIEEEVLAAQRAVTAKKPGGHEYRDALLSVEQAKAQLAQRQVNGRNYEIQAPFNGLILRIQGTPGKQASIGETLLTMADPATFRIRMEVDERYLGMLQEGQKAFFWLGEDTGGRHPGVVERVARQVNPQTGTIEVSIRMEEEVPWLVEDLTLQAEMIVRESSQGLLVPQAYLFKENPYEVLLLKEGVVEAVSFEGLRIDQQKILVVEGLSEGMLLLDPTQELEIGQRLTRAQVEGGADHVL